MRGPHTKSSWSAIPLKNPSSELKVSSLHNNVIVVKGPLASLKDKKKTFTLTDESRVQVSEVFELETSMFTGTWLFEVA